MATRPHAIHVEEEESYFVSMTDVIIGLLFVFIIMLMFFAMRFQEATQTQNEVTQKQNELIEDLTDSETARTDVLENIGSFLQKRGISVIIVKDEGILRLPEEILFGRSSWELNAKGLEALKLLADALDQVLPCYTSGPRSRQANCPKTKAKIEAIFIEGHADSDPFRNLSLQVPPALGEQRRQSGGAATPTPPRPPAQNEQRGPLPSQSGSPFRQDVAPTIQLAPSEPRRLTVPATPREAAPPKDNLDLSALRATSTFRELLRAKYELRQYLNPNSTPVLSVSGYGQYRPVAPEYGETAEQYKQRNRRIDLRILMSTPKSEDARQMQLELQRGEKRQ